ncbi:hypothetical protein QZH41_014908 [Actinostola sp. cb2023]|nr:hypothetical protein QZH41_014908 [Actinostola sp. cb2023]
MADMAVRRRAAKNPTELSESEQTNNGHKNEHMAQASHGYSWVFAATVCFYGVISVAAFLESRSVPAPKPHDTHYGEFSEDRARVHLDVITSFGPRPTGSIANEIHTVNYILEQIRKIKATAKKSIVIEIDVQRPTGTFVLEFLDGFTSHYYNITNIVVRVSPVTNYPPDHTVLVNAHFDSVPNSLGASDDAVSCATMLEILRVMAECPKATLTHGVIFLFNGAEENVLQASHGFITQHPWAESIRAFINLEAAGAGGKEIVFQTGPEHPWLIRVYTEVAPYPCAQVIGQEIFQSGLIPSDTDFRIFRDYGHIPGIDIAYHSNGYVYHTSYDTPAAITKGSVQRAGENVFSVLMEMANSPLLKDPGEYRHGSMVFFDFMGLFMVHYPERIGTIINSVTFVVASLLILKKFFATKRKGESNTEVIKSSGKCLVTSLGVLVLSWIAGLVLPLSVAILLTKAGHSLTWFCRPYLLIGLFVAPTVLGLCSVHCLAKSYALKTKISLTYIIRNVKWPAFLLLGLTISSIVFSLSGLSFPYSREQQCPKRFFFQHIVRTFHGADGSVIKNDSGIWVNPLDYTGITHLRDVPLMSQAKYVSSDEGVYEGFPYYLPARTLFKKSFYIPGPSPDVNSLLWDFKLLSRRQTGNIIRFTFSITGKLNQLAGFQQSLYRPHHMSIYFATAKDVDLVGSSLGHLSPTHDPSNIHGTTYFLYYSHGTRTEPWIFYLELQVNNNLPKKSPLMDFAIAAHYLNGKSSKTPFLNSLIEQSPDWVFAHSWVNIYESWAYNV